MVRKEIFFISLVILILGAIGGVRADNYVRVIVPYEAGTTTDAVARIIAPKLSEAIGKTMVIENRPGAFGFVGVRALTKAKPDGWTLAVIPDGQMTTIPAGCRVRGKNAYDPRTFSHIGFIARSYFELVIRSDAPFKTLAEMIEYARKNPEALVLASGNPAGKVGIAIINSIEGVKVLELPSGKGGEPEASRAVLRGDAIGMFSTTFTARSHVEAGILKAIGTIGTSRNPFFTGSHTLSEQGYRDFARADTWLGLFAPPDMSAEAIMELNRALNRVLANPEVRDRLAHLSITPQTSTPQELADQIRRQVEWSEELIRKHDIQLPCG